VSRTVEPTFLDLSIEELSARLRELGEPAYRARQIQRWVYRELVFDFAEMTNLPATLRAQLAEGPGALPLQTVAEKVSDGGLTRKALLKLADGNAVEAVLMVYPGDALTPTLSQGEREPGSPFPRGPKVSPGGDLRPARGEGGRGVRSVPSSRTRRTVCASSQVGCAVGCPFCATGMSGLRRSLTAGEIVGQVLHFARRVRDLEGPEARITNVVLMGQGEPLANLRQVWRAVELLNSPDACGLGARHVTISTSGLAPRIRELAEKPLQVGLAVSLHAPDDALRDQLVPVNRWYPIAELLAACREYVGRTNRRVSFEYAMMSGVNDSPAQAERLGGLLDGFLGHVNLIPLNPVDGSPFQPTPWPRILAFRASLRRRGIPCTIRTERGDPIDAACGQLRARSLETRGAMAAPGADRRALGATEGAGVRSPAIVVQEGVASCRAETAARHRQASGVNVVEESPYG